MAKQSRFCQFGNFSRRAPKLVRDENGDMARKTATFTVSVPPEMAEEIEGVRREEYRTRSELIREALRRYFADRPTEDITSNTVPSLSRWRGRIGAMTAKAPDTSEGDLLDDHHDLHETLREAKALYNAHETIHCPYFEGPVTLNADGFTHLTHKPNRQPRNVNEQKLKLRLLKKALRVIRKAGTLQEYRKGIEAYGKPAKDGFTKMKHVEYWAFHDIVGEKKRFLIRAIVRRVGDGKHHFWSVMPHGKIDRQKLYQEGIAEE